MEETFLSFPAGRAGAGLVLLRLCVSAALLAESRTWLGAPGGFHLSLGVIGIIVPISLLIGFATRLSGFLAAALGALGPMPQALFVVTIASAVALLGPGAFSVDARMFGRREIVIGDSRSE